MGRQLADILPTLCVSIVMALIVNAMNMLAIPQWLLLLLQICAGGTIVVLAYEFVYKSTEYRDIKNELFRLIRKIGK